jgi:hypothetical protein
LVEKWRRRRCRRHGECGNRERAEKEREKETGERESERGRQKTEREGDREREGYAEAI